uniref:Uncharacterized protein n=1 Tax=Fagus sylvatica TaxID=28930 RepID=A0A2N9ICS7_FAGSY
MHIADAEEGTKTQLHKNLCTLDEISRAGKTRPPTRPILSGGSCTKPERKVLAKNAKEQNKKSQYKEYLATTDKKGWHGGRQVCIHHQLEDNGYVERHPGEDTEPVQHNPPVGIRGKRSTVDLARGQLLAPQ